MRLLLFGLAVIGLIAIMACGSDSSLGTQATGVSPSPTSTPVPPQPTATPEPTATHVAVPTVTPVPTATRVPAATPTSAPAPTDTPVPTATATLIPTPTATPGPDREALLREFSMVFMSAAAKREWPTQYGFYPDEFKEKCSLSDFAEFMSFFNEASEYSIPEGATYVIDGIAIDGDYGWVYSHFVNDGRQFHHDENEYANDEPAEALWRDGKWGITLDFEFLGMESPCSLEPYMGRFINLPLPAGSFIGLVNGRIYVIGVVWNAARLVLQENQFNDPPSAGSRFYMVSLRVEHDRIGSAPLSLSSWSFKLIGDKRKLYDSGCGVIPSELYVELYPGGIETGNVCFEVEDDDSEFILIYSPSNEDRVFLNLE